MNEKMLTILRILCFLFLTSFLSLEAATTDYKIIAVSNYYAYSSHDSEIYVYVKEKWQKIPSIASSANAISACTDPEGNLWLASSQQLVYFNLKKCEWKTIEIPTDLGNIAPSMFIDLGFVYWQNSIWLSAPDELLCYDIVKNKWDSFLYPIGINGGKITIGMDNRLWLNGVANFDTQNWQVLPIISHVEMGMDNKHIFTLDSHARPWVIKKNRVYFFDILQNKWLMISPNFSFSRPTDIICFQNEIWVCDYGKGIYKYISGEWEKSTHEKLRPSLEYGYELFSMKNYLWINTYFGVGSFHNEEWISHFDYTQHDNVRKLFFFTLATIISLLLVSIALIFIVNRVKNNLFLKKIRKM